MVAFMKHILCFGDSNTHGFIPGGGRYDDRTRWTRLLAKSLGNDYLICEEGLNGRTSSFDDPFDPYKNAMDAIVPCMQTHEPLDLTILMLGSNDMKQYFSPTLEKITDSLYQLAKQIRDFSEAPVLLVSPIVLGDDIETSEFGNSFSAESVAISHQLGISLKNVAEELGIHFFDAASVANPSKEDSLHLTAEGHRQLADALTDVVSDILA